RRNSDRRSTRHDRQRDLPGRRRPHAGASHGASGALESVVQEAITRPCHNRGDAAFPIPISGFPRYHHVELNRESGIHGLAPMPVVFIPAPWRELTGGLARVTVEGRTVGEAVDALERQFAGIKPRLCRGDSLAPGLQVAIDDAMTTRGLRAILQPE